MVVPRQTTRVRMTHSVWPKKDPSPWYYLPCNISIATNGNVNKYPNKPSVRWRPPSSALKVQSQMPRENDLKDPNLNTGARYKEIDKSHGFKNK